MPEYDHAYTSVQPSTMGRLPVLRVGDVLLELEGYRVRLPDGSYVPLRAKEHRLLRVLMENHGRVLSEHELLTRAWGPDYQADSNTLAVHIRRLRHALDPGRGRTYRHIRNIPRAGYTFVSVPSCDDVPQYTYDPCCGAG
jgi:DNA-binding response OmpR family regulator